MDAAVVGAGWCVHVQYGDREDQPPEILAGSLKNGVAGRRWILPSAWECEVTQPSSSGKQLAVALREALEAPGFDFDHPRIQLGLMDADAGGIRWVAMLTSVDSASAGDIRTAIPSDDGALIAVAAWNFGVAVVDTQTGQKLWERMPGSNAVQYAAFSPDAKTVYAGGTEGIVYAMDALTGNVIGKWYASESGREEPGHRIQCLAASPDGRWVAAGTGPEGLVFVGSTVTNKMVKTLRHGGSTVLLVHFSPDSSALASFVPGTLKVWKVAQWDNKKP